MKRMWKACKEIVSCGSVVTMIASPVLLGELVVEVGKVFPNINGVLLWTILWVSFMVGMAFLMVKPWRNKK